MAYDDILLKLGEFGRYQKRIYFLLCLPALSCALHKLIGVFLNFDKITYRCTLPSEQNVTTYLPLSEEKSKMYFPWDTVNKNWSTCQRYLTDVYISQGISSPNPEVVPCSEWLFDTEWTTTVSEWSLVCNRAWVKASADAILMAGVLMGSLIFGDISDRFGRKPTFIFSIILQNVFGFLGAFAPDFWSFTACRFIIGASTSGVFLVAYVLALEMVGPSKRIIAGSIIHMFFSIGFMITAAMAYFVHNWRYLQIMVTAPGLLYMCYWWFIPESARWLISKGRKEEAKEIIFAVAKENKVVLEDGILDDLLVNTEAEKKQNDGPKPSILELFKHRNLFKKTMIIFYLWFVCSLIYYGLSWNTSNLGGNMYLNFVISGLVEIPAYTSSMLLLDRLGRKWFLCPCLILSGLCLVGTSFLPTEEGSYLNILSICLTMLGKFFITGAYGAVYIFSAEQFPTVIRNIGIGAGSTMARVGGILASYTRLLADVWRPLPFLMFGILSLVAGVLSLILPETNNKKLPETIADGENFGKKEKNIDS